MLKKAVRKAAASEEARRTLRYVEPLSDARTPLADFFSILLGACVNRYAYAAHLNNDGFLGGRRWRHWD